MCDKRIGRKGDRFTANLSPRKKGRFFSQLVKTRVSYPNQLNQRNYMTISNDLTQEAPRSPRTRIGGYAILGRTLDKGRALLAGKIGEYHFDCPLDNILFDFKGVKGADVKKLLEAGSSDHEIAEWLDTHGAKKSSTEVKAWSDGIEAYMPYTSPEKKEWFAGECEKLGLDPAKSTLFDMLEADDIASYKK
jgi:hypothetical protein